MKKTLILSAIALMGLSLSAMAQEPVKRNAQTRATNTQIQKTDLQPVPLKLKEGTTVAKKDSLKTKELRLNGDNKQLKARKGELKPSKAKFNGQNAELKAKPTDVKLQPKRINQ